MSAISLLSLVRGFVRPVVTVGFSAASILAAFFEPDAFEVLAPMTGMIVIYWFKERTEDANGGR
jgi:uncharacterized membrane protein required for colicin V production